MQADRQARAGNHRYRTTDLWVEVGEQGGKGLDPGTVLTSYCLSLGWWSLHLWAAVEVC